MGGGLAALDVGAEVDGGGVADAGEMSAAGAGVDE